LMSWGLNMFNIQYVYREVGAYTALLLYI